MSLKAESAGWLTGELLRSLLEYDPATGIFTRKAVLKNPRGWYQFTPGEKAGGMKTGYVVIKIGAGKFYGHRLAWFWVHGEWPKHQIDHINGVRDDNRICNLRDVPGRLNTQNRRKQQSVLPLGVSKTSSGKYGAQINVLGKAHWLGSFDTKEEAHAAYVKAKRELHEGCTL